MLGTVPPTVLSIFGNADTPATGPGVASTSGVAHTKGSWVQVGTDLTQELVGFWWLSYAGASPSAADARALVDIGVDPAGGTAYSTIVENLNCAGVFNAWSRTPRLLWIPLRVGNGCSVGVRHQAALASDVLNHVAWFVAQEAYPWQGWSAVVCDTYGADTAASEGTAISTANQGASGAEGTWVQIGTASKDYRAIIPMLGIDGVDTAWTAKGIVLDIGIDPAGGTAYGAITENVNFNANTSEEMFGPLPPIPITEEIPQGSTMAVRLSISGATSEVYSATLHCFA